MNRYLDEWTLTYYQDMGFEPDLIIQAWQEYQGDENLMLDHLFQLGQNQYSHNKGRAPHLRTAETARLLKKLPQAHHLKLKFEGDDSLKYLKLRKLGLFSKKIFRNTKGLSLEYTNPKMDGLTQRTEHIKTLGDQMYRKLRKLKHLSIKFDFWYTRGTVSARPLLQSLKQTFVGLVSLKLSLKRFFRMSEKELLSYDRLSAKLGPTLRHLDLDFTMSSYNQNLRKTGTKSFPEDLGKIILNRLHRLESLGLNFNWTRFSTKVVRLLINAAGVHLPRLRSLSMSFEGCEIAQEYWNMYLKDSLKCNLQHLKLKLNHCTGLTLEYLSLLRHDILSLCPLLNEIFLSTLNCPAFPKFSFDMEREFYEKLPLKKLKFLSSYAPERVWNRYQEIQTAELGQIMTIEEEVMELKEKAGGEEELQAYYKAEMDWGIYQEIQDFERVKEMELYYRTEEDYHTYQDLQILELEQMKTIEEEMMKIKQKAGGEEEMQAYYQTKMEEERAPKECEREVDEQEYLQWRLDESERIELEECDRAEKRIYWEVVEQQEKAYLNYDDPTVEVKREINLEMMGEDFSRQMEEEQAAIDLVEQEIRRGWAG